MARHADQINLSKLAGAAFREMKELGVLTDTNVGSANTVDLLKSNITTAVQAATNHGEIEPMLPGFLRAVDTAYAIGDISDAILAPLTTVDGLIATTADALVTGSVARSNFLP